MRVAYFVSRFPKVTETFVLYEVLALRRLGVDVELFPLLRHDTDVHHPEVVTLAAHVHHLPFLSPSVLWANVRSFSRGPRRYVSAIARVLRPLWGSANFFLGGLAVVPKVVAASERMRALGVEHVHAHFANHPALAAWLVHELTGIPFSFTGHGSDLHVDRRGLGAKLEHAAFALTVSDYNRELLVEEFGARRTARLQVHRCGVDLAVFEPREQTEDGVLRIVCVASLRAVKGHVHLIDACRLLAQRRVPFECRLVGDGPERAALERRVAAAGLQDSIRFTGDTPRPGVLEALRWANVAALTSAPDADGRREGVPVSLMEAMACGLPVVSTGMSGIPELVVHGETGFLTEPGDVPGIASALQRLAEDTDLRARLGRAGRARIEREFDLERLAARLAERFRG